MRYRRRCGERPASQKIEYRGVLFPQGTLVLIAIAGTNRDPRTFGAPDVFDITRDDTPRR